jgi:mitochondrial fission protein ELM1
MERDAGIRDTWTLSDGHAGNVRQARALAAALGHADARDWQLQPRAPWRWLAPRGMAGARFAFGRDFRGALANAPSLAIGCGRQAALATRVLRERGARAVQVLDPRLDPRHWDLVIAPEHDRLRGGNVLTLVGSLHPVDDAWLQRAREDFSILSQLPQPRTALLLGGPSRNAAVEDAIDAEFERLHAALRAGGGSLLLTTSRRTPARWQELARRRFADVPGIRWFAAGGTVAGDNPYPGLLAWADRIVCTPDSVNMLSEACATRVPVFVLAGERVRGRLRRFHDSLRGLGRVRPCDAGLAPFDVVPLRETARVAAEVASRLSA